MGKPRATQHAARKDKFFIGKKQRRLENKAPLDESCGASSSAGGFFVTPAEKQKILQDKEAKRNMKQKFKPKKEEQTVVERSSGSEKTKKPFDKKKWRLQKYSKKYKLEQWEQKRKMGVMREYYKQIKDDDGQQKLDVQKIYEQYENDEDDDGTILPGNKQEEIENENNLNKDITEEQTSSPKSNPASGSATVQTKWRKGFKKPHLEFERVQEEKQRKKEELARKKAEKAEALKQYKEKKLERHKKLNKKTKKGQPIMKYRMEMLLEQIEKSVR